MKINYGQIALILAAGTIGAAEASSSVKYDSNLITLDYGEKSPLFKMGLADRSDDQIHFLIKTHAFVNHLRKLAVSRELLEFRDEDQYELFMKEFRAYLNKEEGRYQELKAKLNQKRSEAAATWSIFSNTKKDQLSFEIEKMAAELEALEKEILKMKSFDDFCSIRGCKKFTPPKKQTMVEGLKNIFSGFNIPKRRAKLFPQ